MFLSEPFPKTARQYRTCERTRTLTMVGSSGVATVPKLVRTDLLNPRPQFLALGPRSGPRRWSILPCFYYLAVVKAFTSAFSGDQLLI